MKIVAIDTKVVDLELYKPFKVALGTIYSFQSILVRIQTEDGYTGYGESSPVSFVTGETVETSEQVLKHFAKLLLGEDSSSLENAHRIMDQFIVGNTASKAAIDIALHDILAQRAKLPLYQYLGGAKSRFEVDKTIVIDTPEAMAQEAKEIVAEGFNIIKVKVGLDPKEDLQRIIAIRQAVGENIKIRIDANQGWNLPQAIDTINKMAQYDIEAVEQPLKYWDVDGHKWLRQKSLVPIMADESLFSAHDAIELVKKEAADIFNIKLMKCGGLYPANKINTIAEAAGYECMLGCMVETYVGITASASFIGAKRNVTKADIDSVFAVKPHGVTGGVSFDDGFAQLSQRPGLGLTVDW